MKNNNFVIFIISHGRADAVVTYNTLNKSGYTGEIYFICDNEDKTINKYIQKYGSNRIKIFDKLHYAALVDNGNNFNNRRTTTHARNAAFDIAIDLGYKYFMVLDDDYTGFHHRYLSDDKSKLLYINVKNLDEIIDIYLDFYISTSFNSIAFAQGGDFIGGAGNNNAIEMPLGRKCMNSFICSTDRRFWFVGQLNEDVNTYCTLGHRGELFGTIPFINLVQKATQLTGGGMTDAYLLYGTYIKSFSTLIMHPSGTLVSMLNSKNSRLHHLINWNNTVPCIIDKKYKKYV